MTTRLQLCLRAENLKNSARLFKGVSDPYAIVTVTGGVHNGKAIGRTTTIKDSLSPEWSDIFVLDFYQPGVYTEITIEIFDDMFGKKDDRPMGEAKFCISDVLDSTGNEKGEELQKGGKVFAHILESVRGNTCGYFNFQIRALDIKNIEAGLLGLGAADPFFEISRKYADHSSGVTRWYIVYRSKHILDNHNPVWDEDSIGMEELCHCDPAWPLKITVKDWQKNGKHRSIGEVETCATNLIEQIAVKGNADREKAFEIFNSGGQAARGDVQGRGRILVLSADIKS